MSDNQSNPISPWSTPMGRRARSFALGIALAAGLVLLLWGLGWIPAAATINAPLVAIPDLPPLPDVELMDQRGEKVRLGQFRGKPWIAGFIFTRCHETCPMVTGVMAQLRSELPTDIPLVSFTVDPRYDVPAVLADYAGRFAAGDNWYFLTGEQETLYGLFRDNFRVPVAENPDPKSLPGELVSHTTRLVLIDGDGKIRGYFESRDPAALSTLARLAHKLAQQ